MLTSLTDWMILRATASAAARSVSGKIATNSSPP